MGKGFDTFMENEYWCGLYQAAPSDALREYFRIMFDTSPFVTESEMDSDSLKALENIDLNKEDIAYLQSITGSAQGRAYYQQYLDHLTGENADGVFPASAFRAELRNPWYKPDSSE